MNKIFLTFKIKKELSLEEFSLSREATQKEKLEKIFSILDSEVASWNLDTNAELYLSAISLEEKSETVVINLLGVANGWPDYTYKAKDVAKASIKEVSMAVQHHKMLLEIFEDKKELH